jgi:hypothetical protein
VLARSVAASEASGHSGSTSSSTARHSLPGATRFVFRNSTSPRCGTRRNFELATRVLARPPPSMARMMVCCDILQTLAASPVVYTPGFLVRSTVGTSCDFRLRIRTRTNATCARSPFWSACCAIQKGGRAEPYRTVCALAASAAGAHMSPASTRHPATRRPREFGGASRGTRNRQRLLDSKLTC